MENVVWLGGPSGSGKTTIAKRLAVKHGLRYFGADKQMHSHHARGRDLRLPAMTKWESLSADERWLATPAEMADLLVGINEERWALLVDDVGKLPDWPGIIVEGTPLRPALVSAVLGNMDATAWIIPTPDAEARNLNARGGGAAIIASSDPGRAWENRLERELIVARRFHEEAVSLGCRIIRPRIGDTLSDVEQAVEEALLPAIRALPCATTAEERFELRRFENEHLVRHLTEAIAELPALGSEDTRLATFDCECGAPEDFEQVRLTLADFARLTRGEGRVIAAAHGEG